MRERNLLIWVLFFGSLWGISEVVVGKHLFDADMPYASAWISAWAFFILAVARGVMNKPGTSAAIGGIAAVFRLINASYVCHIFGIFLLGVAFDVAFSLLVKHRKRIHIQSSLAGLIGAYSGNLIFALFATYIIRNPIWVSGGLQKISEHVFLSGSFVALASALLVPLGYWLGYKRIPLSAQRSRWIYNGALIFTVIFWALARLAG
jgi:hypothetical protein